MKKLLLITLLLLVSITYSQNENKEKDEKDKDAPVTKMEKFSSKTGAIVKMVDFNLPRITIGFGSYLDTRIRKITTSSSSAYFYQIEKKEQYRNIITSVEYSDLIMLINALKGLTANIAGDQVIAGDYIETKYTTIDGFQIGYYISEGRTDVKWFIELDKYRHNTTVYMKEIKTFLLGLIEAKEKIEELQSKS